MAKLPPTGADLDRLYQKALARHNAGDLDAAAKLYRLILRTWPAVVPVANLLAIVDVQQGRHAAAIPVLEKATANDPSSHVWPVNLGNACLGLERYRDAATAFGEAVRRMSDQTPIAEQARAWAGLGRALTQLGNTPDAVAALDRATVLAPDYAQAWAWLGAALEEPAANRDPVPAFEQAVRLDPSNAASHTALGIALMLRGRYDEAAATLDQALTLTPGLALALYWRAQFFSRDDTAGLRHHRARLDALTKSPPPAGPREALRDRVHLEFGLAECCTRLGDHESAWRHLAIGNAIESRLAPYDGRSRRQEMEAIERTFTTDLFTRRASVGLNQAADQAPVFIVGLPRSATSLTEQILATHPAMFGIGECMFLEYLVRAPEREAALTPPPGYAWPDGVDSLPDDAFRALGQAYMARATALTPPGRRIIDKLPDNYWLVGMIRLMLPQASIVHCTRDLMDTGLSLYRQLFNTGLEYAYDLESLGRHINLYRRVMAHWQHVLPPHSDGRPALHVMDYGRLLADQEAESRALLAYCGLDWDPAVLDFHQTERTVATASAGQVRRPLDRRGEGGWRRYEAQLVPLAAILEQGLLPGDSAPLPPSP